MKKSIIILLLLLLLAGCTDPDKPEPEPDPGKDPEPVVELDEIQKKIAENECVAGIMFLGTVEGPIGDGIIDVIGGTAYETEYPFILNIPYDHYVEDTDARHYILYYPVSSEYTVDIVGKADNLLYSGDDGKPVIIYVDGNNGAARAIIKKDGKAVSDIHLIVTQVKKLYVSDSNVLDMSIYYENQAMADSLIPVRAEIESAHKAMGIAYLGRVKGPIGDGIINVVEDTPYETLFPFLFLVPYDRYVEYGNGSDYFLIVPAKSSYKVMLLRRNGYIIAEFDDGAPVLLCCDASKANVSVDIQASENEYYDYIFQVKDGELRDIKDRGVLDLTVYK